MSDVFNSNEKNGLHIITLPAVLDQSKVGDFQSAVRTWLQSSFKVHIFDFQKVTSLRQAFYRPLFLFHKEIKSLKKQMRSINVHKELGEKLKVEGLYSAMNPIASLEEAAKLIKNGITQERIKLDAEFINPFVESTQNCLKLQANLEVEAAKPRLKPAGEFNSFQIGGQIKIQNESFTGSVVIHFQRDVFFRILDSMMGGQKLDEKSPAIVESAGEILNIIFGQAKAVLNEKLHLGIEQELPTLLIGENLRVHEKIPAVVIPFHSRHGSFYLEIGFISQLGRSG